MTFATIIIVFLAIFEAVAWLILLGKEGELEERELALDKRSVCLDERENRIAQWEDELLNLKRNGEN